MKEVVKYILLIVLVNFVACHLDAPTKNESSSHKPKATAAMAEDSTLLAEQKVPAVIDDYQDSIAAVPIIHSVESQDSASSISSVSENHSVANTEKNTSVVNEISSAHIPAVTPEEKNEIPVAKTPLIEKVEDLTEKAAPGFFKLKEFTWFNLIRSSLILIAIYFFLLLASRLLLLANTRGYFTDNLQGVIKIMLLVFEPVTLVLITGYFILINPVLNGIVIALVLLVGFNHLRNYFNGRIVLLMNRIQVGQKVKVGDSQGIIAEMNRIGIQLKTNKGLQAIGYSSLFNDNFMLMSGDDVGGYYDIKIQPIDQAAAKNISEKIYDLLATAPYLDHSHSLVLQPLDADTLGVKTRVIVKEESHLNDLLSLIKDSGYDCKISKK